jgi:hypothetical protein
MELIPIFGILAGIGIAAALTSLQDKLLRISMHV